MTIDPRLPAAPSEDPMALARVLSRFDIGVISQLAPAPVGSDSSRKWVLQADAGRFILKRRAGARSDPALVAWAHAVQIALTQSGFPAPRLVACRPGGESFVRDGAHTYELFEFIEGSRFDRSPAQSREAGAALARFHEVLADGPAWAPLYPAAGARSGPGAGCAYHGATEVESRLASAASLHSDRSMESPARGLREAYRRAWEQAEAIGVAQWPAVVIHADWHPGNLLFRTEAGTGGGGPASTLQPVVRVAAVLDYDTCRIGPRVIDVANGMLQFSLTRTDGGPETWPDAADETRLVRFAAGYDSSASAPGAARDGRVLSRPEVQAAPWLMVEAIVAETAAMAATPGSFGAINGGAFLRMIERKVRWLVERSGHISAVLG